MNSELITKQALKSLDSYFNHLSMTGYMSYDKVGKLLSLLMVDMFLNSEFRAYITEDDYKIIGDFFYCISGNCLIPYVQFMNNPTSLGTILPDPNRMNYFRNSEDQRLRYTEYSTNRFTESGTKFWD